VTRSLSLLLVIVLSTAAWGKDKQTPPTAPSALPICSVVAKAAEYDGKEVTVRGIHRFEIHGTEFYGQECNSRETRVSLSGAPDFKESRAIRKAWRKVPSNESADVVLRGRFVICRSYGNCSGGILGLYGIQVREVLFVQPMQVERK
jgi:hypothetical protein